MLYERNIMRMSSDQISTLKKIGSSISHIVSFGPCKGYNRSDQDKNHSVRSRIRNAGRAGVKA